MDFSHVSAEVQDQVRGFYEYAYPQRELFDLDELLADLPQVSTSILGKTMRYAGRNKESVKGRRAPTQDPSTQNLAVMLYLRRPSRTISTVTCTVE